MSFRGYENGKNPKAACPLHSDDLKILHSTVTTPFNAAKLLSQEGTSL